MKMPARICLVSPAPITVLKRRDGTFKFLGLLGEAIQSGTDLFNQTFNVTQMKVTSNIIECYEHIKNNLSDFSPTFISYKLAIFGVDVPTPMLPQKIVISSGYNYTNYSLHASSRLVGSALSNFSYMDISCYTTLLLINIFLLALVLIETSIKYRAGRIKHVSMKRIILLAIKHTRNKKFNKFIQLSSVTMMFFFTCFFSVGYQSQQLQVDEPTYYKSYDDIINTPNCTPIFMNSVFASSIHFEFALEGSKRKKIWQKGLSLGPKESFSITHLDTSSSHRIFEMFKNIMFHNNAALVGSEYTAAMMKKFSCSLSDENELFKLTVSQDESETEEEFLGYVVRRYAHLYDKVNDMQRRFFESDIARRFWYTIKVDQASELIGTSKEHRYQQMALCNMDSSKLKNTQNMKVFAPNDQFFSSFFILFFSLFAFAFYALLLEIFVKQTLKRYKS